MVACVTSSTKDGLLVNVAVSSRNIARVSVDLMVFTLVFRIISTPEMTDLTQGVLGLMQESI